ncbi:MAG TPA: electron transport complex subunit E [Clostridia bacterium]|nr:electron transport complex subunit E [Clostridia bacterium]
MKDRFKGVIEPFSNGIVKNNPTFRLVLGTCPTLAITTAALNGLTMGLATTFVLICSNFLISLLRNVIPDKVRIPAYIMIIAAFVTVVDMVMAKFLPDLHKTLGLYIPLIVVNCIIMARAEAFSNQNAPLPSVMDGLGTGIGFTLALTVMGIIREFLGAGSFFGIEIPYLSNYAMTIFIMPAGAFFVYGFLIVLFNAAVDAIQKKIDAKSAGQKHHVLHAESAEPEAANNEGGAE